MKMQTDSERTTRRGRPPSLALRPQVLRVSPVNADDFEWVAQTTGEWRHPANWKKPSNTNDRMFPCHTDDNAFISGARCCSLKQSAFQYLNVQNLFVGNGATVSIMGWLAINRKLVIEAGGTLSIDGGIVKLTENNASHEIGGQIKLIAPGSTLLLAGDVILNPHTPPGAEKREIGRIIGQNHTAVIEIAKGKTLTNNIVIQGPMSIRSQ